jgi:predicted Zn-dependent protease
MNKVVDWRDFLDWDSEQLQDLRFAGYSYIRQGKYKVALPFYKALTVLDPKNAYDTQTLGAIYLETGDAKTALEVLDQSLELSPEHIPSILNRAKALLMLGQIKRGLKIAYTLQKFPDEFISNTAVALVLAYG